MLRNVLSSSQLIPNTPTSVLPGGGQCRIKQTSSTISTQVSIMYPVLTLLVISIPAHYFVPALSPQMVWLNLEELDFDAGTGVRLISVETDFFLQGKLNDKLQNTTAISFLSPSSETDSSGASVRRQTAVVATSAALMMAQTLEL